MTKFTYKASYDSSTKLISFGIIFFFIALGILFKFQINETSVLIEVYGLFTLITIGSYIFSPQKYYLTDNSLIVKTIVSSKEIKLDSIKEIKQIDKKELKGSIRTFASGGLWGYYGKFKCDSFNYTMFATQLKNLVLITTKQNKKIIISPDDLSIIEKIKNRI